MRIVVLKFPYVSPRFCEMICSMSERLEYEIAGVVSFDLNEKFTSYQNYPIYPLNDIGRLSWDVAIYGCEDEDFKDLLPRIVELGIGKREQFKNLFWLLKQFMIKKYEDFDEPTIQETLRYWQTHELTVFNQHLDANKITRDKVFYDSTCDLPYIYFKTVDGEPRRMYFPKNRSFYTQNGEAFVVGVLNEQQPTSPHLYITDNHKICAGDIVIDAGVCEGNFALRYADISSKMYLFESEKQWQAPLRQTFKDYGDKVEIIPRFVSDVTGGENITIDDALPDLRGKNIFLKMDIEGAEPRALRGAKRILTNNKVRASICSYHNADDLIKIKSILQSYGFKTSTSAGYMVFIYDTNIWNTADFRKGIVYAEN